MPKILQVARKRPGEPCNIHPAKWVKMIKHCWLGIGQYWIHCDHSYPVGFRPDIIILHALNQRPHLVEKARKSAPDAKIVGLSYNELWLRDFQLARRENLAFDGTMQAFSNCDLIFGRVSDKALLPAGIKKKWVQMGHLIDAGIFHPISDMNDLPIDVFIPRGSNGKSVYWPEERDAALKDFSGQVIRARNFTESEMADRYRRSRCVLALREDSGPSYSVVEACLCGTIPVVSDYPPITRHFQDGGAIPTVQQPSEIRKAIDAVLSMAASQRTMWIKRNLEYFKDWTMQFQGARIVRHLKGLLE